MLLILYMTTVQWFLKPEEEPEPEPTKAKTKCKKYPLELREGFIDEI